MAGSRLAKEYHSSLKLPVRSPGALGVNDAADPGAPLLRRGDTPGSLGAGGDRSDPGAGRGPVGCQHTVPILLFDKRQVVCYLQSVALAKAQESHTRLRWKEYNDSTVLNIIYGIMPWKGRPGWVEAETGAPREIKSIADKDTEHLIEVWAAKCAAGPAEMQWWLAAQDKIRANCLQTVQSVFREASQLNAEVRRQVATGIERLAYIKYYSDLLMTGLGLVTGASAVAAVAWSGTATGLAYGLTTSFVKAWDDGPKAQMIAIAKEGAKEKAEQALENAGEKAGEKILEGSALTQRVRQLESLIAQYEMELAGKQGRKMARLSARIARRTMERDAEEEAATGAFRSAAVRQVLGKLSYAFVAWSVYDSWHELRETLEAADRDSR